MQSHIKIKLQFKCIIGILDFEREKKQKIIIKLKAKSSDFLDYALICKWLKKTFKEERFKLLEEALSFINLHLKELYPNLIFIKISIYKPKIIKKAKCGAYLKKKY
ncbi:dihydroneopterin aldolase [Campylobacter sp. MIT 97-5078]|uniref:dihydroneopterin aldolase n=1 Tax=Campylobacter sp. MIT 97-5078 TaxID=1548153 RepID=UPI0005146A11|nr:dihydroneopterin aldolase [Campylobacter sp. MIT 97-5078]KGI56547.1 dihydroneopterin aldolase [Campylobacter sp. MIT 97-5078]TQR27002.1 dihydroneopterin aldolase [Campylobacter sp. MIT 97-5078]